MCRLPSLVVVAVLALMLACAGSAAQMDAETSQQSWDMSLGPAGAAGSSISTRDQRQVVVEKEVIRREVPVEAMAQKAVTGSSPASNGSAPLLRIAERKVISTASVSLEVEAVQDAVDQVRIIAESVGGFVEHLDSGGGPLRQRAAMTIRVPEEEFSPALARIEALGSVQSTSQGSEDVSERFIDLKARLSSALREEKSLLALLERANAVSEVLAIEKGIGSRQV